MSVAVDSVMEIIEGLFQDAELTPAHWEELQRKVSMRSVEENSTSESKENAGAFTVYAVSETGLDLAGAPLWDGTAEAEEHNQEQYEGKGTIFELTVELDWSKAVRVN